MQLRTTGLSSKTGAEPKTQLPRRLKQLLNLPPTHLIYRQTLSILIRRYLDPLNKSPTEICHLRVAQQIRYLLNTQVGRLQIFNGQRLFDIIKDFLIAGTQTLQTSTLKSLYPVAVFPQFHPALGIRPAFRLIIGKCETQYRHRIPFD